MVQDLKSVPVRVIRKLKAEYTLSMLSVSPYTVGYITMTEVNHVYGIRTVIRLLPISPFKEFILGSSSQPIRFLIK